MAPCAPQEALKGEKAQGSKVQRGLEGPCDVSTNCMTLDKILVALKSIFSRVQ